MSVGRNAARRWRSNGGLTPLVLKRKPPLEEWKELVTRQERIDDFIHEGSPPNDQPLQILCEDHVGTYPVPVARWHMGTRKNQQTHRSRGGWLAGS
jgi:hypothetical protein